MIIPGAILKL